MLSRFHAKLPAVATTLICLAGVVWALVVPGKWYLLSFGLLGGGELFYVYYLNYIVGCSAPERIRENTAYTNLLLTVCGIMPLIYGGLSDGYGLRARFYLAAAILIVTSLLMCWLLPSKPAPPTAEPTG